MVAAVRSGVRRVGQQRQMQPLVRGLVQPQRHPAIGSQLQRQLIVRPGDKGTALHPRVSLKELDAGLSGVQVASTRAK